MGGYPYGVIALFSAKILESSRRMANPESEFLLGLLIFEDLVAPIAVAVLVSLTAGTAMISLLLFGLAPKITAALFPQKNKPQKHQVP